MRIAVVDSNRRPFSRGGRKLQSLHYARALALLGHEVAVVFAGGPGHETPAEIEATASAEGIAWGGGRVLDRVPKGIGLVLGGHVHVAVPKGVPSAVCWMHAGLFAGAERAYPPEIVRAHRRGPPPWKTVRGLRELWALSATHAAAARRWHGDPPVPLAVVPAPRPYGPFKAASRPWEGRRYALAFVGRDDANKRLGLFAATAAALARPSVAVVDGPVRTPLPANVTLVRGAPARTVAEILGDSKALACPSLAEMAPLVVTEALMAGARVLAAPVGSVAEQAGPAALLTASEDPRTLARLAAALADVPWDPDASRAAAAFWDEGPSLDRLRRRTEAWAAGN